MNFDPTAIIVAILNGAALVLVAWLKRRRPRKGEKCSRRPQKAPRTRNLSQ